jgi:pimeloyl-ACP methyl ester carboxylesterase
MSFFVSADSALHHVAEVNRRAAAAIRARGVDLAGYTTVQSAADLEAIREALGAARISLLAFSYGTHLACAYIRAHGDRVENAVMLGTEGPDHTDKLPWTMDTQLRKLALLVAADPRMAPRIPDFVALYDRVIARLAREPMVVAVPAGRDTLRVPVGPFGLRLILRFDIGDATDLPVFPRLLWSIDHGDPSVLAWFVRKRAGITLGTNAMSDVMDAASGASEGRRALIESQAKTSRFADVVNFPYQVEDVWGAPDLGDEFRSPLVSTVRTLFVSGSLDFNTPPYQAEEIRWGMPNSTHLIVENAGHEQTFWQNDTAAPVLVDFLAGRDVGNRKITYPALRFVPLEGSDPEATHPSVSR